MKTFKGKITVLKRYMLLVTSPFKIEATNWADALVELFSRAGKNGVIMNFSVTNVTLKTQRSTWLKEEYSK